MKKEPNSEKTLFEINNLGLLVADHIEAMLAYWDKELVCRFANNAYLNWFGKTRLEMIDKITMQDLLGPLYTLNKPFIDAVLNGETQQFEREITTPNGNKKNSMANYYPDIVDGVVRGFFVHVVDVTPIKVLQNELKASEQKFKGILESAPDAMIIINPAGHIEMLNAQTEKLFGYEKSELLENSFYRLIETNTDHINWKNFYSKIQLDKKNVLLEFIGLKKNGKSFPIEVNVTPIKIENDFYLSAAIRDITLRKEQEKLQELALIEIKKSNERNKIFVRQAPNAIAMFDTEMRYLAASERWLIDYKLQGQEIIGKSHYDIFPEIGEDWKQHHRECLKGAINQCDEHQFERADGTIQYITWDIRPWYENENKIGGLLMYTADITHIKEKEREKRKIEEILDKASEVARIGTWEFDLIKNTIKWSRITKEIHEVEADFIPDLNTAINFFKEGQSKELISKSVATAIEHGTTYDVEVELITAKGNLVWARAIGQAEFKNGKCVRLYGVFQDIDEAVKAKQKLSLLNNELNTILNTGYVSIIGTDLKGTITHFNKGAETLLQYKASEIINIHTPALFHSEEEVINRGKELSKLKGETVQGFDVFIEFAKQDIYESREWTYIRKDGSHFPVQLVVTAIKNNNEEIVGFLGVATDISAIKKTEKEMKSLLEITTDQNERLKNFAHIVSHNLRSHSGNLSMVLDLFLEENKEIVDNEYLQLLKKALANLKETIANLNEVVLMNNSSISEKLVPINLTNVIEAAYNNVSQLIKDANLTFINHVDKSLFVLGFPAYIDSVILNFITNGIKYRCLDKPAEITLNAEIVNEYIVLEIKDNGIGIDLKRNGAKLFGMYKTFNGNKDARGIGLFISKNQIEAMGGKITVESEINKGTTFKIYFKHEKN